MQINRTFHPQVLLFSFEVKKRLMEEKVIRPLVAKTCFFVALATSELQFQALSNSTGLIDRLTD